MRIYRPTNLFYTKKAFLRQKAKHCYEAFFGVKEFGVKNVA